jgi:hypothetical protein
MVLYKLKKKYAKHQIIIEEDLNMDESGWFISIKYKTKKSIKEACCIIRKDLDIWLNSYLKKGWEIIKDDKQ